MAWPRQTFSSGFSFLTSQLTDQLTKQLQKDAVLMPLTVLKIAYFNWPILAG